MKEKIYRYESVCEICGHLADDEEEEMVECAAGHSICKEHDDTGRDLEEIEDALGYDTIGEKREVIKKCVSPEEYKKFLKKNRSIAMDDPESASEECDEYLEDLMDSHSVNCPICSGENFSNPEFIEYFMKKNNMDRKKIANMIMKEFDTYENFKLYIS